MLSFVMYFDALNVPDDRLQIDVNHLKNAVHVDGIRIMPSWWALTLTGDIPDLRAYGWNDWASSKRIF